LKYPLALIQPEYRHSLALEEGQEVVWRLVGTLLSPSLQLISTSFGMKIKGFFNTIM
jgi:hypothetical protein